MCVIRLTYKIYRKTKSGCVREALYDFVNFVLFELICIISICLFYMKSMANAAKCILRHSKKIRKTRKKTLKRLKLSWCAERRGWRGRKKRGRREGRREGGPI